jgi:serine/threonine-protein kinase RIO1
MMQVINAQNILIMKLLQKQNQLYQELNRKFASSDSGSTSNKPHPQRQTSAYRELNNLEQFSSSSNPDPEPTSRQNNVKIIQRSNHPLPDSKLPRKPRFDC